ncbi:MAG: MBL fold metallo-hydrolase [Acetobacteraceae bacterium]
MSDAPAPASPPEAAPSGEHTRPLGGSRFMTEPEPPYGVPLPVIPGIWRVVANNPGPMTYHGTNTYLIEADDGMTVVDPGPSDDAAHVAAVLAAGGGGIRRILLSHGHRDHVGATAALKAASGAPVFGFQPSLQPDLEIDHPLAEGDEVAGLTVLHTPGHAPDHLCFVRGASIFTGDHVMTWSTSVVAPPSGDMTAYMANLRRLVPREDRWLLPGHGPLLGRPTAYIRALVAHRVQRERAIFAALKPQPISLNDLTEIIYRGISPRLRGAAERNLLGHLIKLEHDGRARREGDLWCRVIARAGEQPAAD